MRKTTIILIVTILFSIAGCKNKEEIPVAATITGSPGMAPVAMGQIQSQPIMLRKTESQGAQKTMPQLEAQLSNLKSQKEKLGVGDSTSGNDDSVKENTYKATSKAPRLRKIIMDYNLAIEVKNFDASFATVKTAAEMYGGYIINSSLQQLPNDTKAGTITMRIPSQGIGSALTVVRKLGRIVIDNSEGTDITDEYVDMEARLANLKASEQRLKELLTKTGKLSDVLAVEKEMTRVRGEIESFEARKKKWDVLVSMATVTVNITESSLPMSKWGTIGSNLKRALGSSFDGFFQSLNGVIVFVGASLPWMFLFVMIIYVAIRAKKSREYVWQKIKALLHRKKKNNNSCDL